jgi:hypothetical protein
MFRSVLLLRCSSPHSVSFLELRRPLDVLVVLRSLLRSVGFLANELGMPLACLVVLRSLLRSVGFLANELLDPPSCNNAELAHCAKSFCAPTWPLAYVVHHCSNTWRGR